MQIVNMVLYSIPILAILIFVHELGHFIAAKLTGMRVDRFSIGFPPRAFGKKVGDTDYCVSWIPVGGYVKIAGMIDESFDTDFLTKEPQPWEFRAKAAWARMFVMSAGVIMNILLAWAIFTYLQYEHGTYSKETTEIGYVIEGSPAEKAGVRSGDRILSVNGTPTTDWDAVQELIYVENIRNDISLDLDRGGQRLNVFIPKTSILGFSEDQFGIVVAHTVAFIQGIRPGMPAEKLGIRGGDTLLTLNGTPVINNYQVVRIIKGNAGRALQATWKHGNTTGSGTATVTDSGQIGVNLLTIYRGPFKRVEYSILQAVPAGMREIAHVVRLFYQSFRNIFAGRVSVRESIGGPIMIAQIATQSAEYGLAEYLAFMAMLSMSLAIINILPIPALDGGHLLMLVVEKASGREIPQRVKLVIQQAGFILLLAFMAFVIYNDISRF